MLQDNKIRKIRFPSETFHHDPVEGVVVACKSRTTGALFGIRLRRSGNTWWLDYAFPIRRSGLAASEGYGDGTCIRGGFRTSEDYPGCPDNGDKSIFLCDAQVGGCGGITSYMSDGKFERLVHPAYCSWCHETYHDLVPLRNLRVASDL